MPSSNSNRRGELVARLWDMASGIAFLALIYLMAMTVMDVVLRAVASISVRNSIAFTELALVAIAYMGLGSSYASGAQVSVTLLEDRCPPRLARPVVMARKLASFAIVAMVTYYAIPEAFDAYRSGAIRPATTVPLWWHRAGIAVGLVVALTATLLYPRYDRERGVSWYARAPRSFTADSGASPEVPG